MPRRRPGVTRNNATELGQRPPVSDTVSGVGAAKAKATAAKTSAAAATSASSELARAKANKRDVAATENIQQLEEVEEGEENEQVEDEEENSGVEVSEKEEEEEEEGEEEVEKEVEETSEQELGSAESDANSEAETESESEGEDSEPEDHGWHEDVASMSWRLFNTQKDRFRIYRRHETCVRGVQPFNLLCVMDFEATCDSDTGFACTNEIIEFPVVLLNTFTLQVEAEFHRFVRPTERPHLSNFCKQLTDIRQAYVDKAKTLPEVLEEFNDWLLYNNMLTPAGKPRFACCTDGPWDLNFMLNAECQRKNIPVRSYFSKWVNIRWLFRSFFGTTRSNIEMMLAHYGEKFVGHQHSGLCDSRNIAKIVIHLIKDGCPIVINDGMSSELSVHWERTVGPRLDAELRTRSKLQRSLRAKHIAEDKKRKAAASASTNSTSVSGNAASPSSNATSVTAKVVPENSLPEVPVDIAKSTTIKLEANTSTSTTCVQVTSMEPEPEEDPEPKPKSKKPMAPPVLKMEPSFGALVDFFVFVSATTTGQDITQIASTVFNLTSTVVDAEFNEIVTAPHKKGNRATKPTGGTEVVTPPGRLLNDVLNALRKWVRKTVGSARAVAVIPSGLQLLSEKLGTKPPCFEYLMCLPLSFSTFYYGDTSLRHISVREMVSRLKLDVPATCENIGTKIPNPTGALKDCYQAMCIMGSMIDSGFLVPNTKMPRVQPHFTSNRTNNRGRRF
ncbi:3'-5' exoribonuclease 1 [Pelomyxa schiedti]|nr:3'-5' exoribonuclease 1 [Pelomyxa schiedti]